MKVFLPHASKLKLLTILLMSLSFVTVSCGKKSSSSNDKKSPTDSVNDLALSMPEEGDRVKYDELADGKYRLTRLVSYYKSSAKDSVASSVLTHTLATAGDFDNSDSIQETSDWSAFDQDKFTLNIRQQVRLPQVIEVADKKVELLEAVYYQSLVTSEGEWRWRNFSG